MWICYHVDLLPFVVCHHLYGLEQRLRATARHICAIALKLGAIARNVRPRRDGGDWRSRLGVASAGWRTSAAPKKACSSPGDFRLLFHSSSATVLQSDFIPELNIRISGEDAWCLWWRGAQKHWMQLHIIAWNFFQGKATGYNNFSFITQIEQNEKGCHGKRSWYSHHGDGIREFEYTQCVAG